MYISTLVQLCTLVCIRISVRCLFTKLRWKLVSAHVTWYVQRVTTSTERWIWRENAFCFPDSTWSFGLFARSLRILRICGLPKLDKWCSLERPSADGFWLPVIAAKHTVSYCIALDVSCPVDFLWWSTLLDSTHLFHVVLHIVRCIRNRLIGFPSVPEKK